jgi:hypothetical protein
MSWEEGKVEIVLYPPFVLNIQLFSLGLLLYLPPLAVVFSGAIKSFSSVEIEAIRR